MSWLLAAPWVERSLGFSLELGRWPTLGLAFLLGTFAVATLSDLKRMSAQREFFEVWVLFVLSVFAYDVSVLASNAWELWQATAVKWGVILLLGLLSWQRVGPIFRLARADVAAAMAAASLMTPVLVLVYWGLLKLGEIVVRPILARGRPYWPFMPVVSLATVVLLGAAMFVGG